MALDIILVANDDLKRMKGLMFHEPLQKNQCAYFDFPREGQHVFWNKNVDFPISLLFCDKDMVVKDIKKLESQQTEHVKPESYEIKYVIEAHAEAPKLYNIEKGKKLIIKNNKVEIQ